MKVPSRYQLMPPSGVDVYAERDWWMVKAKEFAAEGEAFELRSTEPHCKTCQCARTDAPMPLDHAGNPRKRSWHHG